MKQKELEKVTKSKKENDKTKAKDTQDYETMLLDFIRKEFEGI